MKTLKYLTLFVFGLLLLNCNGNKSENSSYTTEEITVPTEMAAEMFDEKTMSTESAATAKNPVEQKIIKTGYLTFETASVNKTFVSIKSMVDANKGFIQNDETFKLYDRVKRSLVIRIPTVGFQPIIDSLSKDVKVFDEQKIELQDVTEEYVDIELRMKAKKELENRYLQILNKANSVKDILEIEAQLASIREEIEAQEGRLKYLQNRISFSTLHITFYEMTEVVKAPSKTYNSRLWQALKGGFRGIGEFVIGIVTLWPLWLIGVLVFYVIKKRSKKNDSKT